MSEYTQRVCKSEHCGCKVSHSQEWNHDTSEKLKLPVLNWKCYNCGLLTPIRTRKPRPARQATAAVTLSQIAAGDRVSFTYDFVQYEAMVKKINRTTATVTITKIVGQPRRSLFVGSTVRVSAALLAKAMVAGV